MKLHLAFRHDVGRDLRFLIARITGAPVHVALIFSSDAIPVAQCIEADTGGVRCISADDRLRVGQWTLVKVPLSSDSIDAAYRFAKAQVGKRYDWVGIAFAWWSRSLAPQGHKDKWFCSELVVAALQATGMPMSPSRPAAWTPRRLWDWCVSWRA